MGLVDLQAIRGAVSLPRGADRAERRNYDFFQVRPPPTPLRVSEQISSLTFSVQSTPPPAGAHQIDRNTYK
jgi:hypothetical protein